MVNLDRREGERPVHDIPHQVHLHRKAVGGGERRLTRGEIFRVGDGDPGSRDHGAGAQADMQMLHRDFTAESGGSLGIDDGDEPVPVPENRQEHDDNNKGKQDSQPDIAAHKLVYPTHCM